MSIWLGEEDEGTQPAVDCVPLPLRCFGTLEESDETEDEIPNVIGTIGILVIRSRSWDAFMDIFRRPYFRRTWIGQEQSWDETIECTAARTFFSGMLWPRQLDAWRLKTERSHQHIELCK